jgi:hypothetical protein
VLALGEHDIVDSVEVARLAELLLEGVSVQVVDVALRCADEVVLTERADGRDGALDLDGLEHVQVDLRQERDLAAARADQDVALLVQGRA